MSVHELLPWYANDTLGPEERAAFESHLSGCPACRAELEMVETTRSQLREAGAAVLADHPSPQALLAAVRPDQADVELDPESARQVRRHLTLCLTCADEAEWLAGETVAEAAGRTLDPAAAPSRRRSMLPWLGLAAAVLATVVALPFAFRERAPAPGLATTGVVPSSRRADHARIVEVLPGSAEVVLMFEVDLGAADYPARLRILTGEREVASVVIDEPAVLFDRLYVVVPCHRSRCRDGDYLGRLTRASGGPEVEYPFRLETAPDRR